MVSMGPHDFVPVVGESFYQDTLQALATIVGERRGFTVMLVPEPTQYDPNAVAVKQKAMQRSAICHARSPRAIRSIYCTIQMLCVAKRSSLDAGTATIRSVSSSTSRTCNASELGRHRETRESSMLLRV
jgi:hypothetical protein